MNKLHAAMLGFMLATGSAQVLAEERQSLIDTATYRGLAADQRAYRVGDLLTVYVVEATRAKSQAATDASGSLGLDVGLSSPSTGYQASLGLAGRNGGGAQTTRLGELRAQISAQVVEVVPTGLLRIEAMQSLVVNGERQQIRLKGFVRPEDIAADNTILSNRIANADLELVGAGVVSESQRQSILYRITKWLRLL